MVLNRVPGFYWARYVGGEPEIARWTGEHWMLTGSADDFADGDIFILSRRLERQ